MMPEVHTSVVHLRGHVTAAGLRQHSIVCQRLEIKWEHLDFNQEWESRNPKSFYNSFAILILGLRWTGTSKLDGREAEAQNKAVKLLLLSIQVPPHVRKSPLTKASAASSVVSQKFLYKGTDFFSPFSLEGNSGQWI
jgi:hypothetical protein